MKVSVGSMATTISKVEYKAGLGTISADYKDGRKACKAFAGNAYDISAIKFLYGLPVTFNWDTDAISPELDAKIKDAAPITHLTKDAPPVFAISDKASDVPGNIHNANFARHLKKLMDGLGVECTIHLDSDFANYQATMEGKIAFLKRHFGLADAK